MKTMAWLGEVLSKGLDYLTIECARWLLGQTLIVESTKGVDYKQKRWYLMDKDGNRVLHSPFGLIASDKKWDLYLEAGVKRSKLIESQWHKLGQLYRWLGPAVYTYEDTWSPEEKKEYYQHTPGVLGRRMGPAVCEFYVNRHGISKAVKLRRWYNKQGQIDRRWGPAEIMKKKLMPWTIEKRWYKNGVIHRDNGPAIIKNKKINNSENKKYYIWVIEGKLHREGDLAAEIVYLESGGLIKKGISKLIGSKKAIKMQWYHDGVLKRVANKQYPSSIVYEGEDEDIKNGHIKKMWTNEEGKLCNKWQASIEVWANGQIIKQAWCVDNKVERQGGPAEIHWENSNEPSHNTKSFKGITKAMQKGVPVGKNFDKQRCVLESWCMAGQRHREDGPALIRKKSLPYKKEKKEEWYIKGSLKLGEEQKQKLKEMKKTFHKLNQVVNKNSVKARELEDQINTAQEVNEEQVIKEQARTSRGMWL